MIATSLMKMAKPAEGSELINSQRPRTWQRRAGRLPVLVGWLCLLVATPVIAGTPAAPVVGAIAPVALGKDRHGEPVDINAYRGKVVVVTFWASWCGYCRQELPALNALQHQAGDQWLKIVAVNVKDPIRAYRPMLRQMHDYDLVLSRDPHGTIAEGYGVKAYPNLWIIDPQGRVASHHVGYGSDSLNEIISQIKRLLTIEMHRQQAATAS